MLLIAKHGLGYTPPAATGTVFADISISHPDAAWIEQLAAEGITNGCLTGPLRYCPNDPVVRGSMGIFLARVFGLQNTAKVPVLLYHSSDMHAPCDYLSDPDVPIDTNHLERALRAIPMGRKAWLFCWTEVGAKYTGIVQSLIVTCRLHDIDPYAYLVDVLQRIGQHPAAQVAQLIPRL